MSKCSVMESVLLTPAAMHGFSTASCLRMTALKHLKPWPAIKHVTWLLVLARLLPILHLMFMLIVSWPCHGIPGPHAACQAAAVCCAAASATQGGFFVALSAAAAATTLGGLSQLQKTCTHNILSCCSFPMRCRQLWYLRCGRHQQLSIYQAAPLWLQWFAALGAGNV